MERFFAHDKALVEGLKVLVILLKNEEKLDNFYYKDYLKGYNLEKLTNSVNYSLRIIPKKMKSIKRMIVFKVNESGDSINIVDISDHYKK